MFSYPHLDLLPEAAAAADSDVGSEIWALLTTLYPHHDALERRRESRHPFPYLIHLWPVGSDGRTPCGERIVVAGKHLSQRGLGFYHREPLPYRRMVAALESEGGRPVAFLVDLTWCRFTKHGWYESGGRFLEAVPSPLEASS
ncbi:MAG: hypothetical protein ACLQLG_06785 [Thermoguttaceae bacterium]